MKLCSRCKKQDVPFGIERGQKDGLARYCKSCKGILNRISKKKHRERVNKENRKYRLHKKLKQHSAPLELYEVLFVKQNGRCAICKTVPTAERRLAIDHCYTTNQVRGLLCFSCNTGLGHFRDNQDSLNNALEYLQSYLKLN